MSATDIAIVLPVSSDSFRSIAVASDE
jgi:hypothetical protein